MTDVIPPSLLFDVALTIPLIDSLPRKSGRPLDLPAESRIPLPAELNSRGPHPEIRLAWNPRGLACQVRVTGRSRPPLGNSALSESNDSLVLFVDTRRAEDNFRAGRFCSAFRVVPVDEQSDGQPAIVPYPIAQQRDTRTPGDLRRCRQWTKATARSWETEVWIPAELLPGFDEVPEIGYLGFSCVVQDSELSTMRFSVGGDFPVTMNPSTWIRMELGQ